MSFILYGVKQVVLFILFGGEWFAWERGVTPLSHPMWPCAGVVSYLFMVLAGKIIIAEPLRVPRVIAKTHNLVLSLSSAVMFAGCLSAVIRTRQEFNSWEFIFCTPPDWEPTGSLFFWSYIYYLSKYLEFVDTALLVWRAKPTSKLHVFHHSLVVVMSWLWVDQVQSLHWIGLLTNTAVHVVMYYYYYLTADGRSPWWKKYITGLQIVQFMGSFMTLPAFFWYFDKNGGQCGGVKALAFNAAFNLVLLALFVQFYWSTYRRRSAKKEK